MVVQFILLVDPSVFVVPNITPHPPEDTLEDQCPFVVSTFPPVEVVVEPHPHLFIVSRSQTLYLPFPAIIGGGKGLAHRVSQQIRSPPKSGPPGPGTNKGITKFTQSEFSHVTCHASVCMKDKGNIRAALLDFHCLLKVKGEMD